jgi:hypothetical protein
MQTMAGVKAIDVQEKISTIEAVAAAIGANIEMANQYRIVDKKTGKDLFYAAEKTGLLRRQFQVWCPDCAPWEVDILHMGRWSQGAVFKLEKPWKCACCCCNRPRVYLRDFSSGRLIGDIEEPCLKCCTAMKFILKDDKGNKVATATSDCIQFGLCCSCPCGPCSRIHLTVRDAKYRNVGRMTRQIPGCCRWCLTPDVDHYYVEFGDDMDPVDKTLLMALAVFLDFRYFNTNSCAKHGSHDNYQPEA